MIICQFYSSSLLDLTMAEEMIIARAHLVLKIFKLRLNEKNNLLAYSRIQGYAAILPQNPKPLLKLLSSFFVAIENNIRVIWSGLSELCLKNLTRFILVQKAQILLALKWLKVNNLIYFSIVINH